VRARLERYRVFGLNVADDALPTEASGDLDRLRALLEKVFAQGRQLRDENARNMDATALLEEAAGVRVRLARKDDERAQWQRELTDARQRLIGTNARAASNGTTAPTPRAQTSSIPANSSQPAVVAAQPSPTPANAAPTTSTNVPAAGGNTAANTQRGNSATRPPASASTNPPNAATPAGGNATTDGKPLEVGSLLPRAAQQVAPTYPATARNARITGKVTVFLMVDEKGAVATVERTDGPELLRRAAEDAARRWKFRPTIVNGQPVRVSGFINFNFTL
jgi:TonB family protein